MTRRRPGRAGLLLALFAGMGALMPIQMEAVEKAPQKPLRHVVLFKFKDGTPQTKIDEIAKAFAALPEKIETITDFEWGIDVSVEQKSKGFTHGFIVTFKDTKGREIYLPHPAHQDFVRLVGPHLADVLVFDFFAH